MKTLFISPQVPWPLDVGSKIRFNNLLRCYAEMGAVTLVCFAQNQSEAQNVAEVEKYCHRVYCLPFGGGGSAGPLPAGKLGLLWRMLDPWPFMVRYFSSTEFSRLIESLVAGGEIDVLHVARLSMAQYVSHVVSNQCLGRRPYRILDIDDLESLKMKRMVAQEPWGSPQKYLRSIEWLKLNAYERCVLPRFDCVLVCSEKDRRRLLKDRQSQRVEVFCNGAEVDDLVALEGLQDDGCTLVFLGAMDYQPNEDAALFFAESIYPFIRLHVPKVRFIIAGKSPSARVRSLENGHDLFVTGYVQDKTQLFNSCTIFVVPIRIGGGTRIKVLEAMAMGKPVVSTTIGCEGIGVAPGENIMVADASEDFAAACVSLLRQEARRQTLGRAGRELVVRSYNWEKIRSDYVKTLEKRLHQTDHMPL